VFGGLKCGIGAVPLYQLVVSTWPFVEAVRVAWTTVDWSLKVAQLSGSELVPGGSLDENGEIVVGALVMDSVLNLQQPSQLPTSVCLLLPMQK
ncbi:hypothetical protein SESBI_49155, partial [Sesbania bispinosa]